MSEEKIMNEEVMSDEELNGISGGAQAYVYYAKRPDGDYAVMESNMELSKEQVIDLWNNRLVPGYGSKYAVQDKPAKFFFHEAIMAQHAGDFARDVLKEHNGDVKFVELK